MLQELRHKNKDEDDEDDEEDEDSDDNDDDGTYLIETFQKVVLNGIELPTPAKWKSSRTLQITYLDSDMMIARTAGGEPHLLLRHSPCSTDFDEDAENENDECDIDTEVTEYFQDAKMKYGSTISRSLVDRAYVGNDALESDVDESFLSPLRSIKGNNNHHKDQKLDIDNIVKLIKAILQGENGH